MNKSNTLSNIWDSACFVEEDEGMDWWDSEPSVRHGSTSWSDRWTAEDEAYALWAAEADAYAMREAEEESLARIEELVAEWNSAMAMREEEPEEEPEAEAEAEEWLWADEGKWLEAQAKALLEMVME